MEVDGPREEMVEAIEEKEGIAREPKGEEEGGAEGVAEGGWRWVDWARLGDGGGASRMAHSSAVTCDE